MSNPSAFTRSMTSSVRLEKGENQMNVLAPYRIADAPMACKPQTVSQFVRRQGESDARRRSHARKELRQWSISPLPSGYRIHTSRARRAETRATPRDEGWPRRREIECPRPALSQCSDFAPLVSIVMKVLSQQRTPSYTNQYGFRHSPIASNCGFKRGI